MPQAAMSLIRFENDRLRSRGSNAAVWALSRVCT